MKVLCILLIAHLFPNSISCFTNQFFLTLDGKAKSEDVSEENNDRVGDSKMNPKIYCKEEEYLHKFITYENKSHMIWVTWNRTRAGDSAAVSNVCSAQNGLPLRRKCFQFAKTGVWAQYDSHALLIDCRISMFCQPEQFEHFFIQDNGSLEKHQNMWKQATIGEYSCLQAMCLQLNGLHLTRKCFYDFKQQRALWASADHLKNVKCFRNTRQPTISAELNTLHESVVTTSFLSRSLMAKREIAIKLLSLLKRPGMKLLPADVQLTGNILKKILTDCQDIEVSEYALKIVHTIMSADSLVLRISAEINATNSLLETFENYLDGLSEKFVPQRFCNMTLQTFKTAGDFPSTVQVLDLSQMGVYAHITRNISVFYVNPSCALISGIAIYDSHQLKNHMTQQQVRYDSLNDLYYRFIYMNESMSELMRETHLELAAFIPVDIWKALQKNYNKSFFGSSVVVFKIYAHDGLFVEQTLMRTQKPFSKILSISLPGSARGESVIIIH